MADNQVTQAVQALNLMAKGIASTDITLLVGKTEAQFRAYVDGVIASHVSPPDPPAVEELVKALLPLLAQLNSAAAPGGETTAVSSLVTGAIQRAVTEAAAMPAPAPVAAAPAPIAAPAPVAAAPAPVAAAPRAMPTLPVRPSVQTPTPTPAPSAAGSMPSLPTRPSAAAPTLPTRPAPTAPTPAPTPTPTPAPTAAAPTLPVRPQIVPQIMDNAQSAAAAAARPRTVAVNASGPTTPPVVDPKDAETVQKLQDIRVKLLRLSRRLGQGPRNTVVAQVLYRLELAEHLKAGRGQQQRFQTGGGSFVFEKANDEATKQEEEYAANGAPELDFACTILVLGKSGVGKSSTINTIFEDAPVDPFNGETLDVHERIGSVYGIQVKIIETPGLRPCAADARHNARIMAQARSFMKKRQPDIVLYFDRLDIPMRDFGDLPLLRIVTETFGPAVWFNAIVVLTHACTAPPDGTNGQPISYDMYVAQRSHVVQQMIRQAAGDMRLMNPVSLAENHASCRKNAKGDAVLPNGQVWKPQLLLLCFASKILTEANSLLNLKENQAGRNFMNANKAKVPPLPFLLSSLLTARKPRKAALEEEGMEEEVYEPQEGEEVGPPPKQVAIPAPDPALPPSFDSENPSHRFRFLESANQWMVRPIVEAHGWDHESGIEGFSVDKGFAGMRGKLPANVSGQITKDKKDTQLALEAEGSYNHSGAVVTTTGLDVQSVGRQLAYTMRSETRWKNASNNKTSAGVSASMVGKSVAYGAKLEDRWKIKEGMKLVLSGGAITAKGDVAYGGNMEATYRKTGNEAAEGARTTLGASFMNWKGDVALGANLTNQFAIEPKTMLTTRANINSRGAGQVSLRASSNDRLQLALAAAVPIMCSIVGRVKGDGM